MKLTKNFSKSEFECKCGCEMPKKVLDNVKILAEQLQAIRTISEQPIQINSAYRCVKKNKAIGGVSNSQHILGKAADIVIKEHTAEETYELLDELMHYNTILQGGLGKYNSFTHYDIRGKEARWDFTKK
tara:strand:- start:1408 stop:1794 length:387 start_codon:yes stop_codon:yes gene_type:complete